MNDQVTAYFDHLSTSRVDAVILLHENSQPAIATVRWRLVDGRERLDVPHLQTVFRGTVQMVFVLRQRADLI